MKNCINLLKNEETCFLKTSRKGLGKLNPPIASKARKQFKLLLRDHRHPSIRARKMAGSDYFEGRIDYHYRFKFQVGKDVVHIVAVGPHDEGLGKH